MDLKDVADMAQKRLSGLDFSALMAAEDPQQALTAIDRPLALPGQGPLPGQRRGFATA